MAATTLQPGEPPFLSFFFFFFFFFFFLPFYSLRE
jgi:hypothetical protein